MTARGGRRRGGTGGGGGSGSKLSRGNLLQPSRVRRLDHSYSRLRADAGPGASPDC